MPNHQYKNLVFTDHAIDRMSQRSISTEAVHQTIQSPDRKKPSGSDKQKFIRRMNQRTIHVVASFDARQRHWVVVSVWVRGEEDRVPLVWQLLTLPFKLSWWLIKQLVKLAFGR